MRGEKFALLKLQDKRTGLRMGENIHKHMSSRGLVFRLRALKTQ